MLRLLMSPVAGDALDAGATAQPRPVAGQTK